MRTTTAIKPGDRIDIAGQVWTVKLVYSRKQFASQELDAAHTLVPSVALERLTGSGAPVMRNLDLSTLVEGETFIFV